MELPPEPVIWGVPVDTFHYSGGHFGELILEASPLRTGPLFDTFHHFGGHFGELILKASPLRTGPLFATLEAGPVSLSSPDRKVEDF